MTMEHGVLLTSRQLGDLRRSFRDEWVLSVYIGHPAPNPAERKVMRKRLQEELDLLDVRLSKEDAVQRQAFTKCVEYLSDSLSPDESEGTGLKSAWVAFVTTRGIRYASDVPAPMPTLAHWRRGAWVAPYIRALKQWHPITVAMVDKVSARLYRYAEGELSPRRRFDVHIAGGQADRLGAGDDVHFHHGTRGATADDLVSQARVAARDHIAHEVADQIVRTGANAGLILGGHEMSVHAVMRNLPESFRDQALLLPGVEMHVPDSVLRDLVSQGASTLRNAADAKLIADVAEAIGAHGRGVAGRDAVVESVRNGTAQRVLLSLRFMDAEAAVAEEIVEAALSHDVDVEVVSGKAAERLERDGGGAMAQLRYVPGPAPEMAGVA